MIAGALVAQKLTRLTVGIPVLAATVYLCRCLFGFLQRPDQGTWVATLSRIPIGSVAGLLIWIFGLAAISDDVQHLGMGNVLIAAFGAGFTECLAVQGPSSRRADKIEVVGVAAPVLVDQDGCASRPLAASVAVVEVDGPTGPCCLIA